MAKLSGIGQRTLIIAGIFIVAVLIGWRILDRSAELPVYHPMDLDRRLVDPAVRGERGEHHIRDFNLTDQRGRRITLASVRGKVLLVDFFFTTCGTICPKMSEQMARVQDAYKDDTRLLLLSHSVTPEIDSVPVLAGYGQRYGADPDRWLFLTGDRAQIYALARRSYFAATDEGDGGPDDFVHTENLVLVDTLLRIRGFYDGTSVKDVDRAIEDVEALLEE